MPCIYISLYLSNPLLVSTLFSIVNITLQGLPCSWIFIHIVNDFLKITSRSLSSPSLQFYTEGKEFVLICSKVSTERPYS